jgi:nijmegen breakage syndrome protein 1
VADSDVEMETATSDPIGAAKKSQHHIENISESDDEKDITNRTNEVAVSISGTKGNAIHPKYPEKVEDLKPIEEDVKVIEKTAMYRSTARDEDARILNKAPKDENLDTSRDGASDVIFSQNLVVRSFPQSAPAAPTEVGGVNFKRFRKVRYI